MKLVTVIPRSIRRRVDRFWRFNPFFVFIRVHIGTNKLRLRTKTSYLDLDLNKKSIAVDCGANVGDITEEIAKAGAEVYAFEPDPNAFRVLSKRFSFLQQVHVYNKGVMKEEGFLSFYLFDSKEKDGIDASVGSSFVKEKNDSDKIIKVECIDLSKFIMGFSSNIDFLKMDIEGAEFDVIEGLFEGGAIFKINKMVVETHERQLPELGTRKEELLHLIDNYNLSNNINLDWR